VSFRREKYIPKGGPDGGDGGDGGNIIVKATKSLFSLTQYASSKNFKARRGEPGRGKNQSGKRGRDLVLQVPLGTVVEDLDTGELLADLVHDNQEVLLIPGGKGGKGNQHFATSKKRAPKIAQPGLPGQEKRLRLSLKSLADIGLIGLPNAGKSTLLARLSTASPKIGDYPFTTVFPNLGVLTGDEGLSLVIADIPGLIEGASRGRGLGHRFLKHIERTKLLLHLLDVTFQPREDILEDFHLLRREMAAYEPALLDKPQIVVINKMDLYGNRHRDLVSLKNALRKMDVEALPISALTGDGIQELESTIFEKWKMYQEKNC